MNSIILYLKAFAERIIKRNPLNQFSRLHIPVTYYI
jgi:hypothetical protein